MAVLLRDICVFYFFSFINSITEQLYVKSVEQLDSRELWLEKQRCEGLY